MSDKPEASSAETTKPATNGAASGEAAAAEPTAGEMTKEEKKFLMLALWDALIAPKWTKDDLIDFGKAIFSKKLFKDMTDAEFNKVFPFLNSITITLGKRLTNKAEEVASTVPAQAPEPAAETAK